MDKKEIKTNNDTIPSYINIHYAFVRLIGPLSIVTVLEPYKKSHKEYKDLLSVVLKWSAEYEIKRDLSLINHTELLDVYNKMDELKGKWLFDLKLGEESELADEIVIWMWQLMILRKNKIESEGTNNAKK